MCLPGLCHPHKIGAFVGRQCYQEVPVGISLKGPRVASIGGSLAGSR